MLDRTTTFMSAQSLGLAPHYREAMQKVLRRLESGEIRHGQYVRPMTRLAVNLGIRKPVVMFNMNRWSDTSHCGTVCCIGCIGGLVDMILGYSAFGVDPSCYSQDVTRDQRRALHALYFPNVDRPYENITVAQAALALRNYLITGNSHWEEVLP